MAMMSAMVRGNQAVLERLVEQHRGAAPFDEVMLRSARACRG
jgi:hypothetical protein